MLYQNRNSICNTQQQTRNVNSNQILHSLADLPTVNDIEINQRATHNQLVVHNNNNNNSNNNNNANVNEQDIENRQIQQSWQDVRPVEINRQNQRFQQQIQRIQMIQENRRPHEESSSLRGLRELFDIYGLQINQSQFIILQIQGKGVIDRISSDVNNQLSFSLLQGLCIIPSICYFSLSKDLFKQQIISDIYILIIVLSNLLHIALRYLLIKRYLVISNALKSEQFDNPKMILFLVAIRDILGEREPSTLTRFELQRGLTQSHNCSITRFINYLNFQQMVLLVCSIYFFFKSEEYSTKIDGQTSIKVLIVMAYASQFLYLCYAVIYGLLIGVALVVLTIFGMLALVGFISYNFFSGIIHFLKYISTKLCGWTSRYRSNQVADAATAIANAATFSSNILCTQGYANAYVKRNTKSVLYSNTKCKDSLCSICLEEFIHQQSHVKQMICCKSAFHVSCIINWAQEKKTCPNCRADDIFIKKQKNRSTHFDQITGFIRNARNALNESSPISSSSNQQQQQQQQDQSQQQQQPAIPVSSNLISGQGQIDQQNNGERQSLQENSRFGGVDQQNLQQSIQSNNQSNPQQITIAEIEVRQQQNHNQEEFIIQLDNNHMFHGHHKNNENHLGIFNRQGIEEEPLSMIVSNKMQLQLDSHESVHLPKQNNCNPVEMQTSPIQNQQLHVIKQETLTSQSQNHEQKIILNDQSITQNDQESENNSNKNQQFDCHSNDIKQDLDRNQS